MIRLRALVMGAALITGVSALASAQPLPQYTLSYAGRNNNHHERARNYDRDDRGYYVQKYNRGFYGQEYDVRDGRRFKNRDRDRDDWQSRNRQRDWDHDGDRR
ncbi:MAG TPA: hypothetical protein VFP59_06970 [Candidatus Angelobacter sp.]|nr:hypothetical protein [Candidatus Angelobacter sp.]